MHAEANAIAPASPEIDVDFDDESGEYVVATIEDDAPMTRHTPPPRRRNQAELALLEQRRLEQERAEEDRAIQERDRLQKEQTEQEEQAEKARREHSIECFRSGLFPPAPSEIEATLIDAPRPPASKAPRRTPIALPPPICSTLPNGRLEIYALKGVHCLPWTGGDAFGTHIEVRFTSHHEQTDPSEWAEVRFGYEQAETRVTVETQGPRKPKSWSLKGSLAHVTLRRVEPATDHGAPIVVQPKLLPLGGDGVGPGPWTVVYDFVPEHGPLLVCDPTAPKWWTQLPGLSKTKGPWFCATSMTVQFVRRRRLPWRHQLTASVSLHQRGMPDYVTAPSWLLTDVPQEDPWAHLAQVFSLTRVKNPELVSR